MKNRIIPYSRHLKKRARELRKNSTLSKVLLWNEIKNRQLQGFQFHRQVPLLNYIVDFYCHELNLVIEVDGCSHAFKQEYDRRRQLELEAYDLKILRIDDLDVKQNMNYVIEEINIWIEKLKHPSNSPQGENS